MYADDSVSFDNKAKLLESVLQAKQAGLSPVHYRTYVSTVL